LYSITLPMCVPSLVSRVELGAVGLAKGKVVLEHLEKASEALGEGLHAVEAGVLGVPAPGEFVDGIIAGLAADTQARTCRHHQMIA